VKIEVGENDVIFSGRLGMDIHTSPNSLSKGEPQNPYGYWSKHWHLVNPKIVGKLMFGPLKLIICFDPPPYPVFVLSFAGHIRP
jgi:hypothetical protein